MKTSSIPVALLVLLGGSVCAGVQAGESEKPLSAETPPLTAPVPGTTPLSAPAPAETTPLAAPDSAVRVDTRDSDRLWSHENFFKRVFSDQKFLVTTWWPAEFRDPSFSAPLLATTAGAIASSRLDEEPGFDQRLEAHVHSRSGGRAAGAAKFLTSAGSVIPGLVGLGSTYLIARWTGNERLAATTSLASEAWIDSGIWVTALKRVFARTRPSDEGRGAFFQYHPSGGQTIGSYPSGHAMGAFTVATVFSEMYDDKRWVPWVSYGLAGAVGLSRVALGRHFPSDVVAGGILGNSIGRMVVAREREREGARPLAWSNFRPIMDPFNKTYGIGYSYSW